MVHKRREARKKCADRQMDIDRQTGKQTGAEQGNGGELVREKESKEGGGGGGLS